MAPMITTAPPSPPATIMMVLKVSTENLPPRYGVYSWPISIILRAFIAAVKITIALATEPRMRAVV